MKYRLYDRKKEEKTFTYRIDILPGSYHKTISAKEEKFFVNITYFEKFNFRSEK